MSWLERIRTWFGWLNGSQQRKADFESWLSSAADSPAAEPETAGRRILPAYRGDGADASRDPLVPGSGVAVAPTGSGSGSSRIAIIQAFDVSRPVSRREELFGRGDLIHRLLEQAIHRGAHGIVFGARGSGKTSLVRTFADYADEQGIIVLYDECDGRAGFARLLRPVLTEIPQGAIDPPEQARFREALAVDDARFDARLAARLLAMVGGSRIAIILDEFDRVEDAVAQEEVATLLKMVSDMRLPVIIVLAGIARNVTDLIAAHPSLSRHLEVIEVRPLALADALDLVSTLGDRAGLSFPDYSRELLAHTSCGSPYHLRLFAMQAGLCADAAGTAMVDAQFVGEGLRAAFDRWAMLNPELADTCRRCAAADTATVRDLGVVASAIARASGVGVPYEDVIAMLERRAPDAEARYERVFALLTGLVYSRRGRIGFDDMLAPQFLLAIMGASRLAHGDRLEAPEASA